MTEDRHHNIHVNEQRRNRSHSISAQSSSSNTTSSSTNTVTNPVNINTIEDDYLIFDEVICAPLLVEFGVLINMFLPVFISL